MIPKSTKMLECLGIAFSTNFFGWNHVVDYNNVSWMMHFWDNSRDDSIASETCSIVIFSANLTTSFYNISYV